MNNTFATAIDIDCKIGECPLWNRSEGMLYWTDIPNGHLYRYDPESDEYQKLLDVDTIGGFTFQRDDSVLLFMNNGVVKRLSDGGLTTVVESEGETRRYNDVIADPLGGVFCGLFPTRDVSGSLCRLSSEGDFTVVLEEVGAPNGMGFSPDGKTFYFTDSTEKRIYQFDFDTSTGEISNQSTFASFDGEKEYAGLSADFYPVPDGMTVDAEGSVWTCLFAGEGLVQINPNGEEIRRIETPVKTSTSLTFGGSDYTDIYLTTGHLGDADENPNAGSIYRTSIDGVRGREEYLTNIGF